MVKFLNCYLYAKRVMALCLRVQFFLANPVSKHVVGMSHFAYLDEYAILKESNFAFSQLCILAIVFFSLINVYFCPKRLQNAFFYFQCLI